MSVLVSVVDSMHGRPAEGIAVQLGSQIDGVWQEVTRGHTDEDGHFAPRRVDLKLGRGVHRLELDIDGYYTTMGFAPFYPRVTIDFRVSDPGELHRIPVLIAPFACVAYREK